MGSTIVIRASETIEALSILYFQSRYLPDLIDAIAIRQDSFWNADPEFTKQLESSYYNKHIDASHWSGEHFQRFLQLFEQVRLKTFQEEDDLTPYRMLNHAHAITLLQLDPRSGITHFPTRTISFDRHRQWQAPQWLFEMVFPSGQAPLKYCLLWRKRGSGSAQPSVRRSLILRHANGISLLHRFTGQ